jgi:tungstate transport system substrate-binding protein
VKKTIYGILALFLLAALVIGSIGCSRKSRLILGTTTSLYDTGLWDYLKPKFEAKYDVRLDIVSGGSGQALEMGRKGDVDVLAVHSKADELKFISDNYAVERVPFACNYFIIVGPESDPAGLKGKGLSADAAFKKLADNPGSGKFVSRGDNSGTHSKEKAIWKKAGFDYDASKAGWIATGWYIDAGQGMGATLTMANEKQAYTLTDEGTYLTYKSKMTLVPMITSGTILLNVYSALVCANGHNPKMAQNLVGFLVSDEIQQAISDYKKAEYGKSLFIPCAGNEPTA